MFHERDTSGKFRVDVGDGSWRLTFLPLQSYAFAYFLPVILEGQGYSYKLTLFLSAPPYVVGAVYTFIIAFSSDKLRLRGIFVSLNALVTILGCLLIGYVKHKDVKYFGAFLAIMGGQCELLSLAFRPKRGIDVAPFHRQCSFRPGLPSQQHDYIFEEIGRFGYRHRYGWYGRNYGFHCIPTGRLSWIHVSVTRRVICWLHCITDFASNLSFLVPDYGQLSGLNFSSWLSVSVSPSTSSMSTSSWTREGVNQSRASRVSGTRSSQGKARVSKRKGSNRRGCVTSSVQWNRVRETQSVSEVVFIITII